MSNRHWKKAVAIVTAAMVVLAGIPALPDVAYADTDTAATTQSADTTSGDGSAAADASGTDDSAAQGEDAGNEDQTGVGKVKKSDWITKKDYELVTESDSYKMYLYKPRLSILLEDKKTGKILESTLSDKEDDGKSNQSWMLFFTPSIAVSTIPDFI